MCPGSTRKLIEKAAFLSLVAAVVGLPICLRLNLLFVLRVHPTLADIRGLFADQGASGLLLLAIWFSRQKSRLIAAALTAAWSLLLMFNYVHTKALNAQLSLAYIGYALDPIFLRGSVLSGGHSLVILATAGFCAAWAYSLPDYRFWSVRAQKFTATCCAVLLLAMGLIGNDPAALPWRQQNVLIWNLSEAARNLVLAREHRTKIVVPSELAQDLTGRARWPRPLLRPNILLVLVESLSGAYVPEIARSHGLVAKPSMTELSAVSARALKFSSAFAQQRQTNRGEYAILCGDYPKLRSEEARMSEITLGANIPPCLPATLKEAGYTTAYLQSAPLAFMLKDKFMRKAGFVQQNGTEYFRTAHERNAWGVDDQTFFEGATRHIAELNQSPSPWFLTLLTVGTHHPYLSFPDCDNKNADFTGAIHCADIALSRFIRTLESRGILDNTLVIITSDESVGFVDGNNLDMQLSQNWIPLLAFAPGVRQGETISDVVLQSDVAISILDYLNLTKRAPHFLGRSLFRHYDRPRSVYFANTYLGKIWALEPERTGPTARLSVCDETQANCSTFGVDYQRALASNRSALNSGLLDPQQFKTAIEYSTRGLLGLDMTKTPEAVAISLIERSTITLPGGTESDQLLFGGQYLTVPLNGTVKLDLDVEVQGDRNAKLAMNFILQGKNSRHVHAPAIPQLAFGDRLRITGNWLLAEGLSGLEAVMGARAVGPGRAKLRFHKSELRLATATGKDLAVATSPMLSLERKRSGHGITYSTNETGIFHVDSCVGARSNEQHFNGHNCGPGFVVYGPSAWAPFGTTLHGKANVRVLQGSYTFALEVSADKGNELICRSEPLRLEAGQEGQVEASCVSDHELIGIELRLHTVPASETGDLEFWNGQLEMTL